jgi:hypothetical protein
MSAFPQPGDFLPQESNLVRVDDVTRVASRVQNIAKQDRVVGRQGSCFAA